MAKESIKRASDAESPGGAANQWMTPARSGLHKVPSHVTRTQAAVLDAHHSLTRLEVDHDLSAVVFDAFPPRLLRDFAVRSVDVGAGGILNVRQLRGADYVDTSAVTHALFLERANPRFRPDVNHALVIDFTPYPSGLALPTIGVETPEPPPADALPPPDLPGVPPQRRA